MPDLSFAKKGRVQIVSCLSYRLYLYNYLHLVV